MEKKAAPKKATPIVPSKRKAAPRNEPSKAPRRSARGAAPSASLDPVKVLRLLLSADSLDFCCPKDETNAVNERGADLKTYSSSSFSPFEELVSALILSRPISHALGLRSIRTIFNEPYELTSPKRIKEAGIEGCRKALDEARTQHKQKTADELTLLATAVQEFLGSGEDDVSLEKVREEAGNDVDKEREFLKTHVKGLGKTGLGIFGRRIQALWPEWYPYGDSRTLEATEKFGLPSTAEELKQLMEEKWGELESKEIQGEDEDAKKRRVFVQILERAVGADLEGNIDSLKSAVK